MGRNIVPRADGDSSLGTASKEYSAIYAKELGGTLADKIAPLDNPVFRGLPSAPTAERGTNTTQLATTAYVVDGLVAHNTNKNAHQEMRAEISTEMVTKINDAIAKATLDPLEDLTETFVTKIVFNETVSHLGTVTDRDIEAHNTSATAHQDIRELIAESVSNSRRPAERYVISGDYIVPAGVTKIFVSGCGGGGGGGFGGGGGGAQSVIRRVINVTPGQIIPITIGEGGGGYSHVTAEKAGSYDATSYPGRDGTDTQFGSLLTLKGGKGAYYESNDFARLVIGLAGGSGGTNGAADTVHMSMAVTSYGHCSQGGRGGDSLFGVGGTGGVPILRSTSYRYESHVAGQDGVGYGSGGGGGGWFLSNYSGTYSGATPTGSGANGVIIIEYD